MKQILRKIKHLYLTIAIWLFQKLPINQHKIVAESFGGKGYADNPSMIYEEFCKRGDCQRWKLIWLSKERPKYIPKQIKWVKYGSLRAKYEWCTAKIWIDNVRHQSRPAKRANQFYIQTWHAPFSVKCVEKDAEEKLALDYVESAKYDGSITDVIISNSKLLDDVYERAFWLSQNTKILKVGLPRNDKLINEKNNENIKNKTRDELFTKRDAFCVLYAPTFRDNKTTEYYIKEFNEIIKVFENKTKKKCVIWVRLHPVAAGIMKIIDSESVKDATKYANAQDLSLAADAVISDYSSIIFDFQILAKPVFIYAPDVQEYSQNRGLLPVFYELPFPKAENLEDLCYNVEDFNKESYDAIVDKYFLKNKTYDDGNASKKIVDYILNTVD